MHSDKINVFVVDDDEAMRDSLSLLLGLRGFVVDAFETTAAFMQRYTTPVRGCLLLDQHLPGTTGLDFAGSPSGKKLGIPIVLMSGRGNGTLATLAKRAGCAAYLDKPVTERTLVDTIRRVCNSHAP